jgi:hypothetical protein
MKLIIKLFKYVFLLILWVPFLLSSCKKDDDKVITPADEVASLNKIQEFTRGNYTFYIFKNDTGSLKTGYNDVYIQLKNNTTGAFVEDANLSWKPLMHMTSMSHACPYSTIQKVENTKTLYKGYFIFIMASDDMDYWEITYNYAVGNDTIVKAASKITVDQSAKVRFKSFTGSDKSKYFVALVNPTIPKVGTNEITAYLYKMVNMLTFTPVENYTIQIDPRMPDMDNHTSPNNTNLVYSSGIYKGSLNLTMTGYWKINLIVLDASNTVIKGEAISGTTTASSIYFEIEL